MSTIYGQAIISNINIPKWIESNIDISTGWLNDICYDNKGKFVAVGGTNDGAYSTDGVNWHKATLPELTNSAYPYRSVVYGGGKFVAVGGNGLAYSTDGINWNAATLPVSNFICNSVFYGNGRFVVVGSSNATGSNMNTQYNLYSTNGVNWSKAILPNSQEWTSIYYAKDKFIAFGHDFLSSNTSKAAYSTNGVNWTRITLPDKRIVTSMCYTSDKEKFVGINSTGGIYYSIDGINWDANTIEDGTWRKICYGNGKFVIIGNSNLAYSTDGNDWVITNFTQFNKNNNWWSICFGDGKFIVSRGYSLPVVCLKDYFDKLV